MKSKLLFFFLLVLAAASAGVHSLGVQDRLYVGAFSGVTTQEEITEPVSVPDTLAFVGDILLARNVERVQERYGADYVFAAMPPVGSTTILVGNFESTIPTKHVPTPDMNVSFSTPTSSVAALANYGFDYLSLANNHSYDKGVAAFKHTNTVLAKYGMVPFGDQNISTSTIVYTKIASTTVALVGVYAVDAAPEMRVLEQRITEASEQSDIQIAYVHWGTEYNINHSAFQERLAKQLIDAGIDAVIGHHPHVVQDIGIYKNAPIFYSLGNFLFDQYFSDEVQEGLWIELTFVDGAAQYSIAPITARGSFSQPRLMSAYDRDRFLGALSKRSSKTLRSSIVSGVLTVR